MFATRPIESSVFAEARGRGFSPALARILAGRIQAGTHLDAVITPELKNIPPPSELKDIDKAIERLLGAIQNGEYIGILTDYDADGLTSHAVIYHALIRFGLSSGHLSHWIGHRLEDGYGISPNLVDKVLAEAILPTVVISADCGSSDAEQIARMHQAGISVIVTDHHQISDQGPPEEAYAVVNPNREDCGYPDKNIAGCMVSWLVMSGLRQALIDRGLLPKDIPKLGDLLDYVALGTVADCVSLGDSEINRAVVSVGIQLIRAQKRPCWSIVIQQLAQTQDDINSEFLAFQVAPRLNARGRIRHAMRGFEFLAATSMRDASSAFKDLDADNQIRRAIEKQMVQYAKPLAERQKIQGRSILIVLLEQGHSGVQGIVASRLVAMFGLPSICLTPGIEPDLLTGSMRSIAGLDAKLLLDRVVKADQTLLSRYGGHIGACGLILSRSVLEDFCKTLHQTIKEVAPDLQPQPRFSTDGELLPEDLSVSFVRSIDALGPFGRGFEQPSFVGVFQIISNQSVGKERSHLSLELQIEGYIIRGIWFNALPDDHSMPVRIGDWIECVYTLSINTYRGVEVSLTILYGEVIVKRNT